MAPAPNNAPAKRRGTGRPEKRHLDHFETIARPSDNYQHNTGTFYYRISELIFGSLLASYILGFIAFAPVHLTLPGAQPYFLSKAIADAWSLQSLGIWFFLQSILTSVLYSSFTALLYVNFHQSIVYMAIDQRKASYDFFIAIVVGITFGVSLVFPFTVIFSLGVLTLVAFLRKVTLLNQYGEHVCLEVARASGWRVPEGTSPYDAKIRQEIVAVVLPQLRAELLKSNSRVAKSWGQVGGRNTWRAILVMIFVPLVMFYLGLKWGWGGGNISDPFPAGVVWAVVVNFLACLLVFLFLIGLLFQAGRIMPSKEEMDEEVLDADLDEVLLSLKGVLRKIPGRWRKGRRAPKAGNPDNGAIASPGS